MSLPLLAKIGFLCWLLGFWAQADEPASPGRRRVELARQDFAATLEGAAAAAGLRSPIEEIFIRVFKFENVLEIWGRNSKLEPFREVLNLGLADVRARGPKRREGDRYTPEGCYRIVDFNPRSAAYLSLRLDYPNQADVLRSGVNQPGKDIFIHGGQYSTGCITLGNAGISQLYLLALETKRRPICVHIFPHRLNLDATAAFAKHLTNEDPSLEPFWAELSPIFEAFETTKQVPEVEISADGHYRLRSNR